MAPDNKSITTNSVSALQMTCGSMTLKAADNSISFLNPKSPPGGWTIAISGNDSQMTFTSPESNTYTIVLDGRGGEITLWNGDCAEEFDVAEESDASPGTVMVLNRAGQLERSGCVYDKCVAGIISGAGDTKPGLVLGRHPDRPNRHPLALTGRVMCKVDAGAAPIAVGDLLTTSDTPGHAMKALDAQRAFGAVIGKALQPLDSGVGLIPVLVSLQ